MIIPKNTTLPVVKSRSFTTVRDNQEAINFRILQGDSPLASLNKSIGENQSVKVERDEAGVPLIFVKLAYDINGILDVKVRSKLERNSVTLITNPNISKAWIEKKKGTLALLSEGVNVNPKAQLLISKVEALYRRASYRDKDEIREALEAFMKVLGDTKQTRVYRAVESFEKYVDALVDRMRLVDVVDLDDASFYN